MSPLHSPGSLRPDSPEGDHCARWEAALVDLLDGTLSAEDRAAFEQHAATCEACAALLEESTRGRDWARLLHETPPVVPESLLGRILARTYAGTYDRTAGSAASTAAAGHFPVPGALLPSSDVLVLPSPAWSFRSQRQARILMTAAMAFFSIALTLSMFGFHLTDVQAAVNAPVAFEAMTSRRYYDAKKQVVSFYDNLRVVRELEVMMEDMHNSVHAQGGKPAGKPQPSARRAAPPFAPALAAGSRELPSVFSVFTPTRADERNTL